MALPATIPLPHGLHGPRGTAPTQEQDDQGLSPEPKDQSALFPQELCVLLLGARLVVLLLLLPLLEPLIVQPVFNLVASCT